MLKQESVSPLVGLEVRLDSSGIIRGVTWEGLQRTTGEEEERQEYHHLGISELNCPLRTQQVLRTKDTWAGNCIHTKHGYLSRCQTTSAIPSSQWTVN